MNKLDHSQILHALGYLPADLQELFCYTCEILNNISFHKYASLPNTVVALHAGKCRIFPVNFSPLKLLSNDYLAY